MQAQNCLGLQGSRKMVMRGWSWKTLLHNFAPGLLIFFFAYSNLCVFVLRVVWVSYTNNTGYTGYSAYPRYTGYTAYTACTRYTNYLCAGYTG